MSAKKYSFLIGFIVSIILFFCFIGFGKNIIFNLLSPDTKRINKKLITLKDMSIYQFESNSEKEIGILKKGTEIILLYEREDVPVFDLVLFGELKGVNLTESSLVSREIVNFIKIN